MYPSVPTVIYVLISTYFTILPRLYLRKSMHPSKPTLLHLPISTYFTLCTHVWNIFSCNSQIKELQHIFVSRRSFVWTNTRTPKNVRVLLQRYRESLCFKLNECVRETSAVCRSINCRTTKHQVGGIWLLFYFRWVVYVSQCSVKMQQQWWHSHHISKDQRHWELITTPRLRSAIDSCKYRYTALPTVYVNW